MPNDKLKCTFAGDCLSVCCVVKKSTGFSVCGYLGISSNVDDELRG